MGPDENSTAETLYFKTKDHGYVQVPSDVIPFLDLECDDEEAFQRALSISSRDTLRINLHIKTLSKCQRNVLRKFSCQKVFQEMTRTFSVIPSDG